MGEELESLAASRGVCGTHSWSTRRHFRAQIVRLANQLLPDEDDMVQKGLGWLLREQAKADPKRTVPYLIRIRKNAPRLVLRTACETLTPSLRKQVLKEQRF